MTQPACRILMVIAPVDFRDEELFVPRAMFQRRGWDATTVSTQTGEASGMMGGVEHVDTTLDDVTLADFHALVVVGGMGSPEYLWENAKLRSMVQTMESDGKVVGAICLSGAVLGLAGVLEGKQATVWETPDSRAAIEKNGGVFTGEPVTVDGRIVTANGPEAAEAFGHAMIKAIEATIPAEVLN